MPDAPKRAASKTVHSANALGEGPVPSRLRAPTGAKPFFPLECQRIEERGEVHMHLATFSVQPARREEFRRRMAGIAREYLIDPDQLALLGDERAASILRARVPDSWEVRFGDFGEMLATEYARYALNCSVVHRLRFKPNVHMSMHGTDCVGFQLRAERLLIVKGEAKMRDYLKAVVLKEARETLENDEGLVPRDQLFFVAELHRLAGNAPLHEAIVEYLVGDSRRAASTRHLLFAGFEKAAQKCVDTLITSLDVNRQTHVATLVVSDIRQFVDGVYEALVAEVEA